MSEWDAWIGREETRNDRTDAAAARRWLAMLDRSAAQDGSMPQGYHWCLCLPHAPTANLGPDGHPRRDDSPNGFLPPVPLPRRMWASSKVEFLHPLDVGEQVTRTSRVVSVTEKSGGSGSLVFVDIAHETAGENGAAVRETQSIVYREAADADAILSPPEIGEDHFDAAAWDAHRLLTPNETLLFRYSALTFNSHRIHYDLPYARDEERYRGLVVHGPLTATLLLDLAQSQLGDNSLKTFAFRGLSPAICDDALHLVMQSVESGIELAAFAEDGRQVVAATASL
jgi:3-methylfumaryl-CoA hydratase